MKTDKILALAPILLFSLCPAVAKNVQDVNVINNPGVNVLTESGMPYYSLINNPGTFCYFSVPPNKYLKIESINGFSRAGNVVDVLVQASIQGLYTESYHLPKTGASGINYFYDLSLVHYADDEDRWASETLGADFRVVVETDGTGDTNGRTQCSVSGMLFDLS